MKDVPKVRLASGISLYYEEHGSGPPLLLIPGLGYWHWCWFKQIPELSRHFRLIALDNRGVGESDKPDEPYSIAQMAAEAAEVIAALGLGRTHVLGTSMGGFIAQELALAFPERVAGLVLVCTSPGGPEHVPPAPEALAVLQHDPGLSAEENLRRAMPIGVAPGYWEEHRAEQEKILQIRLSKPVPLYAYQRQLGAVVAWTGTGPRLRQIQSPTLVVHGDRDQLVPMANGRRLAELIPGARLHLMPGAGHLCFIEQPEPFNQVVTEFLQAL